jgi:hypothetical protein
MIVNLLSWWLSCYHEWWRSLPKTGHHSLEPQSDLWLTRWHKKTSHSYSFHQFVQESSPLAIHSPHSVFTSYSLIALESSVLRGDAYKQHASSLFATQTVVVEEANVSFKSIQNCYWRRRVLSTARDTNMRKLCRSDANHLRRLSMLLIIISRKTRTSVGIQVCLMITIMTGLSHVCHVYWSSELRF